MRSILFVCAGNICRSPLAEAIFRQVAVARPPLAALEIGSAGTIALEGNHATREVVQVAREQHGLDLAAHRARNMAGLDADLILTMDVLVTRDVRRLAVEGHVELLGDYAGTGEIVDDPYGCPVDTYRACGRHLEQLVQAAADRLERDLIR